MSVATVYSRAIVGMEARVVTVGVHLSNGLPSLSIVGMAEKALKESKDRVRSTLLNSQFNSTPQRITINLARAYHRILKVARTIADLADCEAIETIHLTQAIGYRRMDT
jgi:predicted ATPase with chaperone activity